MKRTILYGALTTLLAGSAVFFAFQIPIAVAKDGGGGGGGGGFGGGLASLKTVAVPEPRDLATYVKDKPAAIRLGKALFWDMQAGGDGKQSCASCHSAAGADNRTRNTVNPHGLPVPPWAANALMTPNMFPITDRRVVGSAGLKKTDFNGIAAVATSDFLADLGTPVADPVFNVNGNDVRQVTGRQAPPVINAVYNYRFFWDGRARETFNGVNPGGATDPNARVLRMTSNGDPELVQIQIANASAASQAVGPPNNSVEMSFNGRTWPLLGKKMLRVVSTPLAQQNVAIDDSVLAGLRNQNGVGLNTPYAQMVSDAFQNQWWQSSVCVNGDKTIATGEPSGCPNSYTVMEANFPLFWGLAIQLYEATLIANDTPFDNGRLTAAQQRGMQVFTNAGRCVNCHSGAELTKASVNAVLGSLPLNPATGFFNTGVRPPSEDFGIQDAGIADRAMFKTPHLRNVELTGPYFHNGSAATLRDVVDFYNRGGDHRSNFTDSKIRPLGLSDQQKDDLVQFLVALTDERVRFEKKPFDHPSLLIHNGADANGNDIDTDIVLPAVGANGRADPLRTFLKLNPRDPSPAVPLP